MKKCPYCAEEIQEEAIKCKHCGEMLNKQIVTANQTTTEILEEKTIKEEKPALKSYAGIFFLDIILLPFFGLGLILFILTIIGRNNIRYTITNKRVRVKKGILKNKIDEIDISHIRVISLRQDFFAKILGYGDLLIGTSGTAGYEIILKKINKPQETMDLIKDLQSKM